MLECAVGGEQFEADLAAGRIACPDYAGPLTRWGFRRERPVRMLRAVRPLRPGGRSAVRAELSALRLAAAAFLATRNSSPGDAGRYLHGQHVSVAQAHGSAHAEDVRSGIGFGPDVVAEAQPIYERSSVRELVRSRTVVGVPGGPPFPDAEPGSWIPPHVGCGSAPCVARSADFAEVCRRRCFCRRQVDEFSSNETRGFRNCATVPLRHS
jgi:hypothetical protein